MTMDNVKTCADFTEEHCALHPQCHGCPAHKKPTNYDRIRNMSVEEMAEFILMMAIGYCSGQVPKNIKEWLESEVEGE
jgi:hypothetical protein